MGNQWITISIVKLYTLIGDESEKEILISFFYVFFYIEDLYFDF